MEVTHYRCNRCDSAETRYLGDEEKDGTLVEFHLCLECEFENRITMCHHSGWVADLDVDLGGCLTPVMRVAHGESFTLSEWMNASSEERVSALTRRREFQS